MAGLMISIGKPKKGALAEKMFSEMAAKKAKEETDAEEMGEEEDTDDGEDYGAEKLAAAKEVRSALESKDDEAFSEALAAFIRICQE